MMPIEETLQLFSNQPVAERNKIYFIHLNHTNPLLDKESHQYKFVKGKGYNVAEEGLNLKL